MYLPFGGCAFAIRLFGFARHLPLAMGWVPAFGGNQNDRRGGGYRCSGPGNRSLISLEYPRGVEGFNEARTLIYKRPQGALPILRRSESQVSCHHKSTNRNTGNFLFLSRSITPFWTCGAFCPGSAHASAAAARQCDEYLPLVMGWLHGLWRGWKSLRRDVGGFCFLNLGCYRKYQSDCRKRAAC